MAPKLDLIAYQPSFLDLFIEWRIQPLSVRHNPLKAMSREEIKAMLESEGCILSDLAKNETYRWFIQCDDAIVGNVSLKNISHTMRYAEIGYGVAEHHHGLGIATAAVNLLVKKSFSESPLRKLVAYVHDQNVASCRVLEKAGFAREGMLREHYLINGVPENEILFGLLKHEWEEQARTERVESLNDLRPTYPA
jgi:RimJ/RimL family protein N-acetyltransferase